MGMPRRPDQDFSPQGAPFAPGSTSGIFRGRLVIISGTGNGTGLFVYNGQPATGNEPIISATSATQDPFGNPVDALALDVNGTGGNKIAISAPAGFATENFYTGTATEAFNTSLIAGSTGSGVTQQQNWTIFGPVNTGSNDRILLEVTSAVNNSAGSATGFLIFQDTATTQHQIASWGQFGMGCQFVAGLTATAPGTSNTTLASETQHTPGYGAGWADGGNGALASAQGVRYWLGVDQNAGLVFIGGTFHQTSVTPASPVFTFPAAYRPASQVELNVINYSGTSAANIVSITTGGAFIPDVNPGNGNNLIVNGWYRLAA